MRTFIILMTALLAFGITALMGLWLIPLLRKVKYGQTILDIGPVWHKNKQGTPTMGGFLFIAGVLVSVTVGYLVYMSAGGGENEVSPIFGTRLFAGMIVALAFAFLGFVDDYVKVVKKRNLGLTAGQKMIMQILIAALYLVILYLAGDTSTVLRIPFVGSWDLGLFYYPVALFILIVGTVNAVNLTDGIDGLATGVTIPVALFYLAVSAWYGLNELTVVSAALAGGLSAFLIYNFHPAKVFMGDTGSLFLGGMVCGLAFALDIPLVIPLVGLIYVVEVLSDIIQVVYYRKTHGKRFFRMAPLHHHLEIIGWSETKLFCIFSGVTLVLCCLAFLGVMDRYPM